jgi:anti-sigma B factor antagonist
MRIDERAEGDVTVLDVTGRITADAGDVELKDKINSLLNQGRSKILLNLGGVAFVDSTGLGQIVASFTSVSNNKGQMKLLNVTKRLNDLLIITKLTNVFDTFDDESEALKSFK